MRTSVSACGCLGAVHAASEAELGHEVVGVDVDARKVAGLSQRRPPFREAGFEDLLGRTLESGRLRFTADVDDAAEAQLHFVCGGTSQRRGEYAAHLRYVGAATESLIDVLKPELLVVGKSTVPRRHRRPAGRGRLGQGPRCVAGVESGVPREGLAVQDTLHPDRLVHGLPQGEDGRTARMLLDGSARRSWSGRKG